jgi:aminoglycoside phosphotransferase (APT) family kinase protein
VPSADDPTFDAERAAALISDAFPSLRPVRVSHLGRGWDHDVYLANEAWVFRFPRNGAAASAVPRELALLPWLAPQLPVTIPSPVWDCVIEGTPGWRIAGHPLIPGRTVCDAGLDASARAALAPALAGFFRALHSLPPQGAPIELPPDPLRRLDVEYRGPLARTRIAALEHDGVLPAQVAARLLRIVETPPASPPDDPPAIVHADVHTRNVLIGESGQLTGVIDWVDVHCGRPAIDLAGAWEVLPPSGRAVFFARYGAVSELTVGWARWRAVTHTIASLHGARERGDVPFGRACRQALIEMTHD